MLTRCHLCGATVDTSKARPLPGLPGCAPLIYVPHKRPDGGTCRVYSGMPEGYTDTARRGTIADRAATLSVAHEAPESAE